MRYQTILLFVALITNPFFCKSLIYVNSKSIGQNDGTSWINAYNNLDTALVYAQAYDTIWVAEGIYKPGNDANRNASFRIYNNIKLIGGFNGTESSLTQRDYMLHKTILCGDIGKPDDSSDNSFSVVQIGDINTSLDGFIVQNGNGEGENSIWGMGGALRISGQPVIKNCILFNNYSVYGGAVGYTSYGMPRFENCQFISNRAKYGGAVYNTNAISSKLPVYIGCLFNNNSAESGGALYLWKACFKGVNCTFVNNNDNCIYAYDNNSLYTIVFINSLFYNNSSSNSYFSFAQFNGASAERSWRNCLFPIDANIPQVHYFINNIMATPIFSNAIGPDERIGTLDDNYQLSHESPGRNMGYNNVTSTLMLETDFYQNKRVYEDIIDIGAFETFSTPTINLIAYNHSIEVFRNPLHNKLDIDLGISYNDITVKILNMNGSIMSSRNYRNIKFISESIIDGTSICLVLIYEKEKLILAQKVLLK